MSAFVGEASDSIGMFPDSVTVTVQGLVEPVQTTSHTENIQNHGR